MIFALNTTQGWIRGDLIGAVFVEEGRVRLRLTVNMCARHPTVRNGIWPKGMDDAEARAQWLASQLWGTGS